MIEWAPALCERLAPPGPVRLLLEKALAENPGSAALHAREAYLRLDVYDIEGAASSFEQALRLAPSDTSLKQRLASCYNEMRDHEAALKLFVEDPEPQFERGAALLALGRGEDGEAELRRLLVSEPGHTHAASKLFAHMRHGDRVAEIVELCAELFRRGARHSQLFFDWGRALALSGDLPRSRALLFDRSKLLVERLPTPRGFADLPSFNKALAEELLDHPATLGVFRSDDANRGSFRVQNLLSGRRPGLIRLLLRTLEQAVNASSGRFSTQAEFDPWRDAVPSKAFLRAWGLIQKRDAYETWHTHRGGWLSGVYYVRVPDCVTAAGAGPGCIEFGPPQDLQEQMPGVAQPWRHAPKEGDLILSPSHYAHRTIPTGRDDYRISFAFDVVRQ
ncbi:MAG: putative 2OG-Fe(II) oxygenase [Allosphingosinicella sp.]